MSDIKKEELRAAIAKQKAIAAALEKKAATKGTKSFGVGKVVLVVGGALLVIALIRRAMR